MSIVHRSPMLPSIPSPHPRASSNPCLLPLAHLPHLHCPQLCLPRSAGAAGQPAQSGAHCVCFLRRSAHAFHLHVGFGEPQERGVLATVILKLALPGVLRRWQFCGAEFGSHSGTCVRRCSGGAPWRADLGSFSCTQVLVGHRGATRAVTMLCRKEGQKGWVCPLLHMQLKAASLKLRAYI